MCIIKKNNFLLWIVLWMGARIFYKSGKQAFWIYEKIRRPSSLYYAFRNLWNFCRGIPKVHAWVSAVLEPVFGCNLRCNYCWGTYDDAFRDHMRPKLMSWEMFQSIMDVLPESVESVTFGGFGEPLLHPRILDMIEYSASQGKRVCMYTNGVLLKGKLLDELAISSLSTLNVSMEPDTESSQKYRGVNFNEVCHNIRIFSEKRRKGLELQFSVVVHAGNKSKIAAFEQSWKGVVDTVKISPQVLAMKERCGSAEVCSELWRGNLFILTNGAISLCCYDRNGELLIGKIDKEKKDICLDTEKTVPLLEGVSTGRIPNYCRTCSEIPCEGFPKRIPKKKY